MHNIPIYRCFLSYLQKPTLLKTHKYVTSITQMCLAQEVSESILRIECNIYRNMALFCHCIYVYILISISGLEHVMRELASLNDANGLSM